MYLSRSYGKLTITPFLLLSLWNSHYMLLTWVISLSRHTHPQIQNETTTLFMCKLRWQLQKVFPQLFENVPKWSLVYMFINESAMFSFLPNSHFLTSTAQEVALVSWLKVSTGRTPEIMARSMWYWVWPKPPISGTRIGIMDLDCVKIGKWD
jgi:hypothetical protein